jgi:hypothetical protein
LVTELQLGDKSYNSQMLLSNLRTALLYASGYFNSFSDKLGVVWSDVYDLCRADGNAGVVYVEVDAPLTPETLAELRSLKPVISARQLSYEKQQGHGCRALL